jgi:hypothetical protein
MRAHTREIGIRQTEQLIEIFFSWFFDSHGMTLRPTSNIVTPAGDRPSAGPERSDSLFQLPCWQSDEAIE